MARQAEGKVPDLRFKGFHRQWERKKLGEIVQFLDELRRPLKASDRKAGPYPYYGASGIIDHVEGYLFDERLLLFSEDGANIINRSSPMCFVAEGKYWVNNHAHVMKPNAGFTDVFIRDSLELLNFEQFNTGTAQPKLNQDACRNMELNVPCADEQAKIGTFFECLDRTIELHQQKHEKLVSLKQAMLQKMFPHAGATTPEIRFKGFEGEWRVRTFGETTLPISSNTLSRADLNYKSGAAQNVHYGDILVRFREVLDADNPELPYIANPKIVQKFISSRLQDGDVVIADAAEDEAVGKCTELFNVGDRIVLAGLHTIAVRPSMTFAPFFLGYFLNSHAYHNQLLPLMQGTKVLSVSRTTLNDTSLMFPSTEDEQAKIGTYFYNLDKLISKHAIQLEKLKSIKSACLEKMFV